VAANSAKTLASLLLDPALFKSALSLTGNKFPPGLVFQQALKQMEHFGRGGTIHMVALEAGLQFPAPVLFRLAHSLTGSKFLPDYTLCPRSKPITLCGDGAETITVTPLGDPPELTVLAQYRLAHSPTGIKFLRVVYLPQQLSSMALFGRGVQM
jgi:hypothetical protein